MQVKLDEKYKGRGIRKCRILRKSPGPHKGAPPLRVQKVLQGDREGHRIQEIWLMFMDRFAEAINIIKTHERMGRAECMVNSTKFLKSVLATLKKESYINDFEEFKDGKITKIKVKLSNRINAIGVVKPRYAVQKDTIQKYETRYIPSKDFGILVLSTPKGLMTNKEAREK